jgi:hypothetical protein
MKLPLFSVNGVEDGSLNGFSEFLSISAEKFYKRQQIKIVQTKSQSALLLVFDIHFATEIS